MSTSRAACQAAHAKYTRTCDRRQPLAIARLADTAECPTSGQNDDSSVQKPPNSSCALLQPRPWRKYSDCISELRRCGGLPALGQFLPTRAFVDHLCHYPGDSGRVRSHWHCCLPRAR
eukprot:3377932-Pleurochrysis_carterae.AAC.3